VPHHVVGKESDGAALEARQAGDGDRLEAAEKIAERVERIAIGESLGVAVRVAERQTVVLSRQDKPRLRPEERIARPRLAALN
jgi:hypothetical protein